MRQKLTFSYGVLYPPVLKKELFPRFLLLYNKNIISLMPINMEKIHPNEPSREEFIEAEAKALRMSPEEFEAKYDPEKMKSIIEMRAELESEGYET